MDSLTETGAQSHLDGGAPKKNPRASRAEMESRLTETKAYLRKHKTADVYQLAESMDLSIPQALTLVSTLMKDGKVERAGREGRRIMYRLAKRATAQPEAQAVVATPVASADLPVRIGEQFEVTGIHLTAQGTEVELQSGDKTLTMVA